MAAMHYAGLVSLLALTVATRQGLTLHPGTRRPLAANGVIRLVIAQGKSAMDLAIVEGYDGPQPTDM